MLDDILECLVEQEMRVAEIVARGHDLATVKQVERLLYLAEYKRRQAAPGVKVTRKNFGRDRRYPITNRFRDQGQVAFQAGRGAAAGGREGGRRCDEARGPGRPRLGGGEARVVSGRGEARPGPGMRRSNPPRARS